MKPSLGRIDEVGNFFWAQDAGQATTRLLRIRCFGHAPCSLHGLSEKETQRGQPLRDGACGELLLAEEICLVLTDVLRTKLVGRAFEVARAKSSIVWM